MTVRREPTTTEQEYAAADQLRAALRQHQLHTAVVTTEGGWSTRRTGRLSLLLSIADAARLVGLLTDAATTADTHQT